MERFQGECRITDAGNFGGSSFSKLVRGSFRSNSIKESKENCISPFRERKI